MAFAEKRRFVGRQCVDKKLNFPVTIRTVEVFQIVRYRWNSQCPQALDYAPKNHVLLVIGNGDTGMFEGKCPDRLELSFRDGLRKLYKLVGKWAFELGRERRLSKFPWFLLLQFRCPIRRGAICGMDRQSLFSLRFLSFVFSGCQPNWIRTPALLSIVKCCLIRILRPEGGKIGGSLPTSELFPLVVQFCRHCR